MNEKGVDNPVPTRSFVLFQGPPDPVTPPRPTCSQTVTSLRKPDTRSQKPGNFRAVGVALNRPLNSRLSARPARRGCRGPHCNLPQRVTSSGMGALSRGRRARRQVGTMFCHRSRISSGPEAAEGTGTGTATGHLAARYQRRTKPRSARANIRLTGLKAPSVHRLNRVEQVDPHHDQGHYAGSRDGVGFC